MRKHFCDNCGAVLNERNPAPILIAKKTASITGKTILLRVYFDVDDCDDDVDICESCAREMLGKQNSS